MSIDQQTTVIQNRTLDPVGQAKDTLKGIEAGAGLLGALPGAEATTLGEKALGVAVDGNTMATEKIVGVAAQQGQQQQNQQQQQQQKDQQQKLKEQQQKQQQPKQQPQNQQNPVCQQSQEGCH